MRHVHGRNRAHGGQGLGRGWSPLMGTGPHLGRGNVLRLALVRTHDCDTGLGRPARLQRVNRSAQGPSPPSPAGSISAELPEKALVWGPAGPVPLIQATARLPPEPPRDHGRQRGSAAEGNPLPSSIRTHGAAGCTRLWPPHQGRGCRPGDSPGPGAQHTRASDSWLRDD